MTSRENWKPAKTEGGRAIDKPLALALADRMGVIRRLPIDECHPATWTEADDAEFNRVAAGIDRLFPDEAPARRAARIELIFDRRRLILDDLESRLVVVWDDIYGSKVAPTPERIALAMRRAMLEVLPEHGVCTPDRLRPWMTDEWMERSADTQEQMLDEREAYWTERLERVNALVAADVAKAQADALL